MSRETKQWIGWAIIVLGGLMTGNALLGGSSLALPLIVSAIGFTVHLRNG